MTQSIDRNPGQPSDPRSIGDGIAGQADEAFETLSLRKDGSVLFADISVPPMNLLNPTLVRDLISLLLQAEADDTIKVLVFRSANPRYFRAHVA